jgi:hypothetical protein
MNLKRWLFCYVDDNYIGPVYTAWPIMRQLRHLQKRYQSAKSHEVRTERGDSSVVFKRTYKDWAMEQLKRVGN